MQKINFILISALLLVVSHSCKSTKNPNEIKMDNTINNPRLEVKDTTFIKPIEYIINKRGDKIEKVIKTEDEWRVLLTKEEFSVLREKGTEKSFSGDLWENKKDGLYICAACDQVLFTSSGKYDSGTGWPSFFRTDDDKMILKRTDNKLGYPRVEIMCAKCEGHLGHLFEDGPPPAGLRYCINSVSLDFIEAKN